jgi:sugar fermentation stimulation protein A
MRYQKTMRGTFIERPNRFTAFVEINGKKEKCHVKNTGRCKEILIPGAETVLNIPDNPDRATKYDLIGVYKGKTLVNIDSQAPNEAVAGSIRDIPGFEDIDEIRPEYRYGDSRFDIFAKAGNRKMLMEVKGVTLEKDGIALFPDAPTERGLKHVKELGDSLKKGYEPYILFLIQMTGPKVFSPNHEMHEEFASEVEKAYRSGVKVLAYDSVVTEDSLSLGRPIEVRFGDHS